jgi:hypothetical protein
MNSYLLTFLSHGWWSLVRPSSSHSTTASSSFVRATVPNSSVGFPKFSKPSTRFPGLSFESGVASCALALSQCHSRRLFIFPLVVKNDVKKRTVNLQIITAVIVDEPQFPKPVHEVADSCASCAHHLR